MFGKFNLNGLMKNAQQLQDELEKIYVTGESGAGAVIVHMNAKHNVSRVELSDDIIKESKEVLEELVAAACNDAASKVEAVSKEKMMDMSSLLGGIMGGANKDNEDKS